MSGRYRECLDYPVLILIAVFAFCALALLHVDGFRFDASEDTLVAEGDPDLAYYREISSQFGGEGFLVMTYMPRGEALLSDAVLGDIDALVRRLEAVDGVASVDSILDAPLLQSPPVSLSALASDYRTLQSSDVDYQLAKDELTSSPFFRELLISGDGSVTALRINLTNDSELQAARAERDRLQSLEDPTESQLRQRDEAEANYREAHTSSLARRDRVLAEVRTIRDEIGGQSGKSVVAHLGGVPMIAADMVDYVKQDVTTFGTLVVLLVSIMLYILFRRVRWVVVPLASTGVSILLTIGVLGYLQQPTTVVSSNFISLLVIITISFSIHLISRYRELRAETPDGRHVDLVFRTMMDKLAPCFYTALTTMVAFASLTTSDIVPVMDFGWIMSVGIVISFLVSYSFFAAVLLLLPKGEASRTLHHEPTLTRWLSDLAVHRSGLLLLVMVASCLFAAAGMTRLSLENRFVDYFRPSTEIHAGLTVIDRYLGGTVPMDIVLGFDPFEAQQLDESSDFFSDEVDEYPERYWFTPAKIRYLEQLHAFLESRPAIGKVLSLYNLELIARDFNDGRPLGAVELVAALDAMPDELRRELIDPYATPESGILRVAVRLHETDVDYELDTLISDIETFAQTEMELAPEQVRVTGMAVLFNGMLRQLFDSQTSTLLFVVTATLVMFLLLLRSLRLAVLGLLPNLLAAGTALGIMGFAGIPLDIMTITIAAIIIGIGVDDAIHYLHRFKEEYARLGDAKLAVKSSHASIGNAIYYTSITVIIGFSVLGFSNFMPTVHFGLMTALAMVLALLANLALLPALLVLAYRRRDRLDAETNDMSESDTKAG